MKKLITILLISVLSFSAAAQESDLLGIDFDFLDSIFDEPAQSQENEAPQEEPVSIVQSLRRRGFEFNFSYIFRGAVNPGWVNLYPWEQYAGENFTWAPAVNLGSTFGIDARISDSFRVQSVIKFDIPGEFPYISLGEFFFDYNFSDKVFLRAGKTGQSWGISPNFGFTDLLSRIPEGGPSGPSYLIRFDVPIGIGGVQLLAQTRSNIANGDIPDLNSIGFGGKYNLAFQWADFNLGAFYQNNMASRAFFTVKTTLRDFEIYSEWLAAFDSHADNAVSFAFNFGFLKSFFNNKLDLNAEIFYNGEGRTNFFNSGTEYELSGTNPFLGGVNAAVNLLYRFNGGGSPRFFTRFLYGDDSFSIVPGIRLTPFQNMEIYLALPVSFGNGHYKTEAKNFKGEIKPVSLLLYVTFKGDLRANYYY